MQKFKLITPDGGTLNTAGKFCADDIEITPKLQEKNVTKNGSVSADEGFAGLGKVVVAIPEIVPKMQEKTVTQNGEVTPDVGYDGLSKVTVKIGGLFSYSSDATATITE